MRAVAGVILLLTASCGSSKPSDAEIDLISDIAGPAAETAIEESDKIKNLEDRVDTLEDRLDRANIPD